MSYLNFLPNNTTNKILKKSWEYKGNSKLAKVLSKKGYKEIEKNYTYIGPKIIKKILNTSNYAKKFIRGLGLDLGGGPGIVSSTLALSNKVDKIYCNEIVENAVKYCHPIVKKKILKKKIDKVISIVGDFNNLNFENSKFDFAIIWDSFHHSSTPTVLLREIRRVLKKNSYLFIIDRAHNNNTLKEDIDRALNHTYNLEFLKKNYFPLNKIITRKMNGEREYKFNQLENFFKKTNFKIVDLKILCSDQKMKKNDIGINEIFFKYKMGGFFKRKVIYSLKKI
jgi:ubiquinone/menaquinone biosynthesis C-methylase UbiE